MVANTFRHVLFCAFWTHLGLCTPYLLQKCFKYARNSQIILNKYCFCKSDDLKSWKGRTMCVSRICKFRNLKCWNFEILHLRNFELRHRFMKFWRKTDPEQIWRPVWLLLGNLEYGTNIFQQARSGNLVIKRRRQVTKEPF